MLSGGGCLPLHSLPLVPLRCRHCCCMRQLSQPPACPSKLGVATCLLACACLPAHLQPLCAPSALPAWRLAGSSAARQRRHWPGAPAARWRFEGPARNMASRRQRQRRCLKLNAFCLRPQFCQGSGPHPYPHAISPCCTPACCCTIFGEFRFAPACRASNKVPSGLTPVPPALKCLVHLLDLPRLVWLSAGNLSGCDSAAAWNV